MKFQLQYVQLCFGVVGVVGVIGVVGKVAPGNYMGEGFILRNLI